MTRERRQRLRTLGAHGLTTLGVLAVALAVARLGAERSGAWILGPRIAAAAEATARDRPETVWRVAVIDSFYPGDDAFASEADRRRHLFVNDAFDIDGDRRRDPYYHGDIVRIFLKGRGIEAVPYVVGDPSRAKEQILHQLNRIREQRAVGGRIDGLVLAWESSTLLSAFEGPLVPEERKALQERIRQWSEDSDSWRTTYRIILALEELARDGVAVYTIAGNAGVRAVNTYSFAEGVRVVGDAAPDPEVSWIASNGLVDVLEQAAFKVRLIHGDSQRALGYDIDEDGEADIPVYRVSSYRPNGARPPRESWIVLRGSSFAAPLAMRRHLLAAR